MSRSLVTFLASDDASSISGTLQLIDRGASTSAIPTSWATSPAR